MKTIKVTQNNITSINTTMSMTVLRSMLNSGLCRLSGWRQTNLSKGEDLI